jgi:hypothetical protein
MKIYILLIQRLIFVKLMQGHDAIETTMYLFNLQVRCNSLHKTLKINYLICFYL